MDFQGTWNATKKYGKKRTNLDGSYFLAFEPTRKLQQLIQCGNDIRKHIYQRNRTGKQEINSIWSDDF